MCSKTGDFYIYYGFLSRFYSHIISCPRLEEVLEILQGVDLQTDRSKWFEVEF